MLKTYGQRPTVPYRCTTVVHAWEPNYRASSYVVPTSSAPWKTELHRYQCPPYEILILAYRRYDMTSSGNKAQVKNVTENKCRGRSSSCVHLDKKGLNYSTSNTTLQTGKKRTRTNSNGKNVMCQVMVCPQVTHTTSVLR